MLFVLARREDGTVDVSHIQVKADKFEELTDWTRFPDVDFDALQQDGEITAIAL